MHLHISDEVLGNIKQLDIKLNMKQASVYL